MPVTEPVTRNCRVPIAKDARALPALGAFGTPVVTMLERRNLILVTVLLSHPVVGPVVAGAIAPLALSACSADPSASSTTDSANSAPGPTDTSTGSMPGESPEVFFEANCVACHGPTGNGIDGIGPDIAHPVRDYSTWVVRNGREPEAMYPTGMLSFGEAALSDEMLEGVLDLLASQPQPTSGEALFADYCAACHGSDANGGPTMRSIRNETAAIERLVRAGHDLGSFEARREFMPRWSTGELSDDELQSISVYIESL